MCLSRKSMPRTPSILDSLEREMGKRREERGPKSFPPILKREKD